MIYFDAGATTLEKPEAVRHAMARAVATMSSPGRGTYPASRQAEETAYQCRSEAAELFGMDSPENVIFTGNATQGLNVAIKTLVKPGSRVIISGYEHNAVTRPLHAIPNVRMTVVDTPPFQPGQMAADFAEALRQGADAVICNHVSNVFGCIQPVDEIAELCRRHRVPLIVDASQSAGVLPVRMDEWQAAFIAMPGHKGLYGPQGTGLLLCNHDTRTLMEGGTGSLSRQQQMPEDLPDRLEAGTHNMPGIAGLLEGIRFVRRRGVDKICRQEQQLTAYAGRRIYQPDRRAVVPGSQQGLRGSRRAIGTARYCRACRLAMRAAGSSYGGHAEKRYDTLQRIGIQHHVASGSLCRRIAGCHS